MGGFGSGRNEYARTATVGESFSLGIADLNEHLDLAKTIVWRWGPSDDPTIWIGVGVEAVVGYETVESDGEGVGDRLAETNTEHPRRVRFSYTVTPSGASEPVDIDDQVQVVYTAPPMGGMRPWFVCPDCDERREELHLPPWDRRLGETPTRFRCRECHELGYETSRVSGTNMREATVRFKRAFAQADAHNRRPHPNSLCTPERPSGRHESTHEDLVEDVRQARAEWDVSFHRGLARYAEDDSYQNEHFSPVEDADAEMFLES